MRDGFEPCNYLRKILVYGVAQRDRFEVPKRVRRILLRPFCKVVLYEIRYVTSTIIFVKQGSWHSHFCFPSF